MNRTGFRTITKCMLASALALCAATAAGAANAEEAAPGTSAAPTKDMAQTHDAKPPIESVPRGAAVRLTPAVLVPMGNLADATGPAIGGLLGAEWRMVSRASLTLDVGYFRGLDAQKSAAGITVTSSLSYLPMLIGLKQYVFEPQRGIYLAANGGLVAVASHAEVTGSIANVNLAQSSENGSWYFGGSVGLGYQYDSLDFGVALFTPYVTHASDTASVMARLSWNITD